MFTIALGMFLFRPNHIKTLKYDYKARQPDHLPTSAAAKRVQHTHIPNNHTLWTY